MEKIKKYLVKLPWLCIILISIPAIWALLVPGFYGASDDMHIAWLYEMDRAIKGGQFPPRFAPDLSFGFGYPLFNFLFPLPFYFEEIFHLVGFSLVDSIKLMFLLSIPLSAGAMYLLLRQFSSPLLSLAGTAIYIYAPYRAVDLYIRGANGEILAFVFLPLIILSVIKLSQVQVGKLSINTRWIGIGGLSLAALFLSHNISAYMFTPFVILLVLLEVFFKQFKKIILIQTSLMIFLGLLISLYFWLPALLESRLMKYDTVFNFIDHFPTLRQLVTLYWGYGASVPGPGDGMSFFLGISSIAVLIIGIFLMVFFRKKLLLGEKLILFWSSLSLLIVIVMMNHRSAILWDKLPLLSYFQFPWRFLIMTTFLIPIFTITLKYLKKGVWLSVAILVLTVLTSFHYFRPEDFLGREDKYFLNRFIPVPVPQPEYFEIQEEYLRLSKFTERRPEKQYPLLEGNGGTIREITSQNDLQIVFKTSSDKQFSVNINKYFFPGWVAVIDGQVSEITPGYPFGQIVLAVPAGDHEIKIFFTETNFKKVLDIISLLSLGLTLLVIFRFKMLSLK